MDRLILLSLVAAARGSSPASYKLEEAISWNDRELDLSDTFSLAEGIGVSYSLGFVSPSDTLINTNMASTYLMTLSNGTVYRCGVVGPDASDAPTKSKSERKKITVQDTQEEARRIIDAASPWCALWTEGWWTYEVCYGNPDAPKDSIVKPSKVRQFHVVMPGEEVDTAQVGKTDFTLGKNCLGKPLPFDPLHKSEKNHQNNENKNVRVTPLATSAELLGYFDGMTERSDRERSSGIQGRSTSDVKYVWDVCKGGDTCDFEPGWVGFGSEVHGEPRETEVRYGCGPSEKPALVNVQEPSSCRYVFDVRFKALCEVPGLVGEVLPVRQIECWEEQKVDDSGARGM